MRRRVAGPVHNPENLPEDLETVSVDLGPDASDRFHRRLFSRVPRPIQNLADRTLPALHHSVLDLECNPHDCVDSASRPQWTSEQGPPGRGADRATGGMAAVLRVFRGPGP